MNLTSMNFGESVVWIILALIFGIGEKILKGYYLYFLSLCAVFIAIIVALYHPSVGIQIVLFISASYLTIIFFRQNLIEFQGYRLEYLLFDEEEFVNNTTFTTAFASTDIPLNRTGKIKLESRVIEAVSDEVVYKGDIVRIIDESNNVVKVKVLERYY